MSATHRPATRVVDYEPRHRDVFRTLNIEWIETYFTLEDADRTVLDDPEGTILRDGGAILIAEDGGVAVGCCALIRMTGDTFELAKIAVSPEAQGRGIGTLLARGAVEWARRLGARRIELQSNSLLQSALHVYRKVGFVDVPLGSTEYRRADVQMVLRLDGAAAAPPLGTTP